MMKEHEWCVPNAVENLSVVIHNKSWKGMSRFESTNTAKKADAFSCMTQG